MDRGPKVVVLGAGSYFFGKPVIYNMITSPILRNGTLALVDTDPAVLETMMKIARRAKEAAGAPLTLEGSTDRLEVMKGADFVVLSFSYRNAYYRELDTRISKKYGVTMCSSDTIGPGGIFRALRELPEILRIADDVRRLAPEAWLINFINPTSVMGIALMRHAADVKSFALCDGNHMPYVRAMYLRQLGILPEGTEAAPPEMDEKFDLQIAGVNHCTWILRCFYDGKDYMPVLRSFGEAAPQYELRAGTDGSVRRVSDGGEPYQGVCAVLSGLRSHAGHAGADRLFRRLQPGRGDGRSVERDGEDRGRNHSDRGIFREGARRPRHGHHRIDVGQPRQEILHQFTEPGSGRQPAGRCVPRTVVRP